MNTVSFPTSAFVPIAVGFFGLGTGYLIYGAQELFGLPGRDRSVDLSTGIWGIFMPGFMQLFTGVYLWAGLAWFHSFDAPALYMAALAFTAYGVHWFSLGLERAMGSDPRPNEAMAIAFMIISALGIVVFFKAGDWPVGLVFVGLAAVYVCEFVAGLFSHRPGAESSLRGVTSVAGRALGATRLLTAGWLMYMTFAVTLNTTSGTHLPT